MTKLTETQTIVLRAGAQRPDNIALPLPKGLAGAAAKMAVTKMIERGWLQKADANLRRGDPLWRETGDGHGATLVVTDAGLLAIGMEPVVAQTVASIREHGRAEVVDRLVQRLDAEVGLKCVGDAPGQHLPGIPVHDGDQIQKAPAHRDVGDIGTPDLVGRLDPQPAPQIG